MNYIKHLTGFFDKVAQDRTLNPTHISLYIALFQFWNCNRFKNPISISRDEVMRISKISSKATYHKCLKNLHSLGYINYEPSFNPFKGSHVFLFNFSDELKPLPKTVKVTSSNNEPIIELVNEQVANKHFTSSETSTEQAVVPYINNINTTNILKNSNLETQAQNFESKEVAVLKKKDKEEKEKKLREKKKENLENTNAAEEDLIGDSNPTLLDVKNYFLNQNFPEIEAQKFFNYFSSIGWLVGGKSQMVNWRAAAQNWILNANKFNSNETKQDRAHHLNTSTDKDYSEPL
jgi:hypothetical protein